MKYKYKYNNKKCNTCRIKYKYCKCFLEYTLFNDDLMECKCTCCNNNYQKKIDEKLKEQFFNTYTFSNHDINKFISLLRKDVCSYEYTNDWKKFNEISLSKKENF